MPSCKECAAAITWHGSTAHIRVRITPNSSSDSVDGVMEWGSFGNVLQVRVRAIPDKGAANKALIRVLSKHFDIPLNHISLEKGMSSRVKTVHIQGLEP